MIEPEAISCPNCHQLNPPEARFCDRCGSDLPSVKQSSAAAYAPASRRTIITVDASSGGVVAIGQGARAVRVEGSSNEVRLNQPDGSPVPDKQAPSAPAPSGFCPHCGKPTVPQGAFCPHCGTKL